MKKLIIVTILSCLCFPELLGQQGEALSYRFQRGDEFYFKAQTTVTNEPVYTSEVYLQFNVREVNQEQYEMSMRYVRMNRDNPNDLFDSSDYYPGQTSDIGSTIQQVIIDKPVLFSLSNKGIISDIHFSEELNKAIKTHILGIQNKYLMKKFSLLNDQQLEATIRFVFPMLPNSANKQKWSTTQAATALSPELEMNYELVASNADQFTIKSSLDYENTDSAGYTGEIIEIIPEKIWQDGAILLDKSNGLLAHAEIKNGYKASRKVSTTGGKAIFINNESTTTISRQEVLEFGQPTYISGTLPPSQSWKEIRFHLWSDFPDRDLLDLKIVPEKNEFSARFLLQRPTELAVVGTFTSGTPANFGNMLLEPGDSIHLELEYAEATKFSGKGAAKNQAWNQIKEMGLNLSRDMKLSEVNRISKRNIKERGALLEAARPDISEWAYEHLQTDMYFREQRNRYNYYSGNIDTEPNPELFEKIFGELDFETYSSSRSFEFRWFAWDYLGARANIFHKLDRSRLVPKSELYALARLVLDGEHEYYMKAHIIGSSLKLGRARDYEPLYSDFTNSYPGSPLIKSLKEVYDKKGNIALSEIAPDFRLTGIRGPAFRLSEARGKWVMLVFCDLEDELTPNNIAKFAEMANTLPEDHFELVVAFTHKNKEKTRAFLKDADFRATFLDNESWKNSETHPYDMPYVPNNFLINPDGEFEFIGGLSSWELYLKEFMDYIKRDMADRAQLEGDGSKTPTLWIILGAIALVLLIWGYFVLKTARLKRKEQEKLEKVELEIMAVRSQLNPHFLFNAMSSIQHLVNVKDNEKANIFLSKFAGLMRRVLNQADLQLLSLAQELETLKDYLDLEALRHGFSYELNIAEEVDIYSMDIPPMLLQPFVENAVVHGISQIKDEGQIIIDISQKTDESISIKIIDNGIGLNQWSNAEQSNGKGLDLTRRRVALIMEKFRNEISFALSDRHDFDGQQGAFAEIIVGLEN